PYLNVGPNVVSAGPYSFTVTDANGCSALVTGTISQPSQLFASASNGTIACKGGTTTVNVSATGGTAPYSNVGSHVVSAGPYSFIVTDANGCSALVTGTISQPSVLSASASNGTIACNVCTTTVNVSMSALPTRRSSDLPNVVSAGPYSFTVTDANGCSAL